MNFKKFSSDENVSKIFFEKISLFPKKLQSKYLFPKDFIFKEESRLILRSAVHYLRGYLPIIIPPRLQFGPLVLFS